MTANANSDAMQHDPTRFRVNLTCRCRNDIVYGYGATEEDARATAMRYFLKQHSRDDLFEEIVECAVEHGNGGSHYEWVSDRKL